MNNNHSPTDENIYADFDAWLSAISFDDDYPEEECPYSCSEEAEVAEADLDSKKAEDEDIDVLHFKHHLDDSGVMNVLATMTFDTPPDPADDTEMQPGELIMNIVTGVALNNICELYEGDYDGAMPVLIELFESKLLNENTINLFISTLACRMDESWNISVIWHHSGSKDCFKVKPITVTDIVKNNWYSLEDQRCEEIIVRQ